MFSDFPPIRPAASSRSMRISVLSCSDMTTADSPERYSSLRCNFCDDDSIYPPLAGLWNTHFCAFGHTSHHFSRSIVTHLSRFRHGQRPQSATPRTAAYRTMSLECDSRFSRGREGRKNGLQSGDCHRPILGLRRDDVAAPEMGQVVSEHAMRLVIRSTRGALRQCQQAPHGYKKNVT